ncbi:MAG: L-glutamate gamma-semialdehyde dehydrogenase [Gemmatimonadales bacterium]|nr:L-glutamate gamma-semialdehyde dehydrogenase [Gemmatimonadales bacterium]
MTGPSNIPAPHNEPVLAYAPGSPERAVLKAELARLSGEVADIPAIVGGREIRSGDLHAVTSPHRHAQVIARAHLASADTVRQAAQAAVAAQREWAAMRFEDRAAVFLRAADLLAGPRRALLNGATMLGQSKTAFQAEIDAACELIDFFRFNVHYAEQLQGEQPRSSPGMWNRMDHRPIEGFVYAVTPFNFTAIGGNLPTAPALMGATAVWKPSHTALLSNYYVMRLLEEAGLPPGVINFVPAEPVRCTGVLLDEPMFAGVHFTGSTGVFRGIMKQVSDRLERYRSYPRIVGETGGKDFVVAHPSADPAAVAVGLVRGAYEYQGQKCSAASRAYVPASLWPEVRDRMVAMIEEIRMGDVADFRNFMGAVIDRRAFDRLSEAIAHARQAPGVQVVAGGGTDAREGWFVQPTLLTADDPNYRLMCEELFGPVLAVHVYPDARWRATLDLVDATSPYALTGAVFARDRAAVAEASAVLRQAAGNFYINDKPTGAVVGQQPFGGARASGTNDKAGSVLNLLRWVSPRSIKETFVSPVDYRYPFMGAE